MTETIIKNSTLFTCTFSVASASRPTSTGCQCEQQDFLSLCLVLNTHTKIQTDYCAVCFSFCSKCYVSSITLPVLQSVLSRPLFISPHPHFKFLRRLKTLAPSLPAFPKSFKLHTLPLQHLWAPSLGLPVDHFFRGMPSISQGSGRSFFPNRITLPCCQIGFTVVPITACCF